MHIVHVTLKLDWLVQGYSLGIGQHALEGIPPFARKRVDQLIAAGVFKTTDDELDRIGELVGMERKAPAEATYEPYEPFESIPPAEISPDVETSPEAPEPKAKRRRSKR